MNEEIRDTPPTSESQDGWEDSSRRLLRTLSSLLLYVAIYTFIFRDLKGILLLVLVIIFHEAGHFIAMKAFGYQDIRLTFVPFFGALISGSHDDIPPFRRCLMVLAGPLPGILVGLVCLILADGDMHSQLFRSGLLFSLLNIFNLLPVKPLDGGQLLFIGFPTQARSLQALFIILVSVLLALYCIVRHHYAFLPAPALLLIGAYLRWRNSGDGAYPDPPAPTQQLVLLAIWLSGLVIPLLAILFIPGIFPMR